MEPGEKRTTFVSYIALFPHEQYQGVPTTLLRPDPRCAGQGRKRCSRKNVCLGPAARKVGWSGGVNPWRTRRCGSSARGRRLIGATRATGECNGAYRGADTRIWCMSCRWAPSAVSRFPPFPEVRCCSWDVKADQGCRCPSLATGARGARETNGGTTYHFCGMVSGDMPVGCAISLRGVNCLRRLHDLPDPLQPARWRSAVKIRHQPNDLLLENYRTGSRMSVVTGEERPRPDPRLRSTS